MPYYAIYNQNNKEKKRFMWYQWCRGLAKEGRKMDKKKVFLSFFYFNSRASCLCNI